MDELKTLPGGASMRVFLAFTVDLQKFHCGRKKKVFTQLQELYCDPLQSRQKNILSSFVLSCLEPYVLLPNLPIGSSPASVARINGGFVGFSDVHVSLHDGLHSCRSNLPCATGLAD
jgi:hypothetical protein